MGRAKADYNLLTQELVAWLNSEPTQAATMARVMNHLAVGVFAQAEPGRILEWFRSRVPGWTVREQSGEPIMHRIICKGGSAPAVAATPQVREKMQEPSLVRVPEFGPDVLRFVPTAEPVINYHARKLGDGKTDVQVLERAWQERRSTLLTGKPGTGKSTAPWVLAQKLQLPIVRISMDETKDASKILGQWVPADGGGFRFVKAPALTLFEQGGILVIEELNAITPGVAFTLHPMLDDLDVMVVDDLGVVARKHPDFWVVATMNPSEDAGAAGTQQVNYALWDRFKCKLVYDYDTSIESKLVHGDERILAIRDKLRGAGLRTEVTTRMLRDFWQNVGIFGWAIARRMFEANFPGQERDLVAETCKVLGG